ncbi:MAG TPA: LptF/LptG family permease [Candidatus Saccharimonadales bacterium]|nr:LptF/LptG family permease [Candidatus Saccharimonadales bacterium]
MNTLHKYLTRQVLASLLLSVMVFTFVLLLGNVLKEILILLINGQARFSTVLEAIGLLIPFVWVFALPMGLLTATLLVFGRFSADQELTAARASGISLLSLVTPVLLLSLFCCGLSAWINMDLGPRSRVAYKKLILSAQADLARFQLPEKQFIRDIPGYIIYVDKSHRGDLQDVMIFVLQHETNVTTTIRAPEGRLKTDAKNKQLVLDLLNPQMVTLMPNNSVRIDSSKGWASYIYPLPSAESHPYHPAISDMTFWQLRNELNDLSRKLSLPPDLNGAVGETERTQLRTAEKQREDLMEPIRVEMNRQVAFSFACFSFTLIGIPLGIRVHRRETNVGVAIALILVLIYYAFIMLGESLSSRPEFVPHLIFWLPNFIFQAVGAVLLWRANRGI